MHESYRAHAKRSVRECYLPMRTYISIPRILILFFENTLSIQSLQISRNRGAILTFKLLHMATQMVVPLVSVKTVRGK